MGRGRAKGKKPNAINHEDPGSGEEEKIPVQKRRGRPLKPVKDDVDVIEVEKVEEDIEKSKSNVSNGESIDADNGKKRKRNLHPVKEVNDASTKPSPEDLTKLNGFRHNGSRRKGKPHRAAEAVVECN